MKKEQLCIRISTELKDKFYSKCQGGFMNPSALIRGWIKIFVEKNVTESTIMSKTEALPALFLSAEKIIKEKLNARKVKIKLDGIDREGNLYFICRVKMDQSPDLVTPKLSLIGSLLNGERFIITNLGWKAAF